MMPKNLDCFFLAWGAENKTQAKTQPKHVENNNLVMAKTSSVCLLEKSPSYSTFSWGILVITRGVVWGSLLCCPTAFAM